MIVHDCAALSIVDVWRPLVVVVTVGVVERLCVHAVYTSRDSAADRARMQAGRPHKQHSSIDMLLLFLAVNACRRSALHTMSGARRFTENLQICGLVHVRSFPHQNICHRSKDPLTYTIRKTAL